ncbi:hypothetical protein M3J09_007107 [Ascochyta lentis]
MSSTSRSTLCSRRHSFCFASEFLASVQMFRLWLFVDIRVDG